MGLLDMFAGESTNAVTMLKDDHEKVKGLFKEFEEAEDARAKRQIVGEALKELEAHATLEEEIFYPAVRQLDDSEDHEAQMDEALEEHHVAKVLIAELKEMKPSDERYDAKFIVLSENVKHHIEEEESEVLPKAEDDGLDLEDLGRKMARRKQQLMGGRAAVASPTQERKAKTQKTRSRRPVKRAVKSAVSKKRNTRGGSARAKNRE